MLMAEQGKLYLNNKIIDSMCDTMKKRNRCTKLTT